VTARAALRFATSNPGKLREASALLHVPVEPIAIELEEIQASTVEAISLHKLQQAIAAAGGPVFVEDVALGFDALGGFPGPYVKWLLDAAGGEGVGRIASGLKDARGAAICHLSYWDGSDVHSFAGACRGRLLAEPRGSGGFGWDAWFLPDGHDRTYAEMSEAEKARVSHRARAYERFRAYLVSLA
jgi:inosine triphosphate pyrophosphatase